MYGRRWQVTVSELYISPNSQHCKSSLNNVWREKWEVRATVFKTADRSRELGHSAKTGWAEQVKTTAVSYSVAGAAAAHSLHM